MSRAALAAALFVLSGCGGGSGGNGGNGGSSGNGAPSFTSPGAVSLVENTQNVVQLSATDPDGDAVTFEILPTKDAAYFIFLGSPGALAFDTAPSFETPRDGNGDNIYEVDVRASDGRTSTTQTILVTVTNSTEGLIVRKLPLSLPGIEGALIYFKDTDRILMTNRGGSLYLVDPATSRIVGDGTVGGLNSRSRVIDIAGDGFDYRGGNFFALATEKDITGTRWKVKLLYSNFNTGQSKVLWELDTGSVEIDGSLGMRGSNVLVALGDGGASAAAQDPADPRGNIVEMIENGSPADLTGFSVTPRTVAWGLHSPRLSMSDNITGWPIDRGDRYNEISEADFRISQADANLEWPIRDGTADLSFAGTIFGTRVAPRLTQEFGGDGPGRWLDAADSLQGNGWFGVMVICDDKGNIWTWDVVNNGPLEKRNLDFGFPSGGLDSMIVSMDDGDVDVGKATPIYLLDNSGEIYVVDLE